MSCCAGIFQGLRRSPAGPLALGDASEALVIKAVMSQLDAESKQKPSGSGWWDFGLEEQTTTSLCTNTTESSGAITYKWAEYGDAKSPLPYPDIVDNTEGIGAFEGIVGLFPQKALVVDIGGGQFDVNAKWVMARRSDVTVLVADPFNRSKEHNLKVQEQVEKAGGADVVTSISVLNVVPDVKNRIRHIALVHQVLKSGGIAIFKTWAGLWPMRGTRLQQIETKDAKGEPIKGGGWCQNNSWASAYVKHIAAVFGDANVFADDNQNAIFATKA
mmetsp:Transcript_46323/g.85121  ORF Transcript_46323/g.85121 Transcript_46323/m.85121 type:complete len:273 (-) Transcript_46323:184-1002(-)